VAKRPTIPHNAVRLGPQPGPQTAFLTSSADIVIYGGAAGGGKTYGLLLEGLRYATNTKDFAAVYFRRSTPQITNPGGLWDASQRLFPRLAGRPFSPPRAEWHWRDGGKIKFAHLQREDTVHDWQGAEIPLICFDELTHFTASQFWYMVSRNRSTSGVKPYIRATCNPDADSWVAEFIAWWIDQATGFYIPERIGVIRYVARVNDKLIWTDTAEELRPHLPKPEDLPPGTPAPEPKSVTFIPAKLTDNPALLSVNPEYLVNLQALPLVERERLLGGNWKIRPAAGLYFQRSWCPFIETAPAGLTKVRYWDLAGTEKTENNDPDWTVGVLAGKDRDGFYYILDVIRARVGPFEVEQLMKNAASADGKEVRVRFGLDPGQAGKAQAASLVRLTLPGYDAVGVPESGDKTTRFSPFSAQARAGNVRILRGHWNEEFCRSLEGFPELSHDDDADGCSGAFEALNAPVKGEGFAGLVKSMAEQSAGPIATPSRPKVEPARGSQEWKALYG
jgi:predicted phage terminase large subunit-like protein